MEIKNQNIYKWIGKYEEGKNEEKCVVVRDNESLELVIGEKNKYLLSVIFSDNEITFGKMTLPSNKFTEVERHIGDEAIYVLEGRLIVNVIGDEEHDTEEREAVIQNCFDVKEGENMYIPAGFKHYYKNLYKDSMKAIIVMAPKI